MEDTQQRPEPEPEFLDVEDSCKLVGVKRGTLDLYVRQGRLTRYKQGAPAKTMYRRKQLLALMEVKQVKQDRSKRKK